MRKIFLICWISPAKNNLESWDLVHMKTDIDMLSFNMEHFLSELMQQLLFVVTLKMNHILYICPKWFNNQIFFGLKFFDQMFLWSESFWTYIFLNPKFFQPKFVFSPRSYLKLKIVWNQFFYLKFLLKIVLDTNIFLELKYFWNQNVFINLNFWISICLDAK